MTRPRQGAFVVFEGGEGAGKSTQIARTAAALKGEDLATVCTREPGGTALGESLRSLLLDPALGDISPRAEALLFAAARAQHVSDVIAPALARGDVVLSDRFLDSSLAYQGVARGLGLADVLAINDFALQGLRPDLTVVLDLPVGAQRRRTAARRDAAGDAPRPIAGSNPASGQSREDARADEVDSDRIDALDDAFHTDVRQAFLDLAAADPGRYLVLDAQLAPEEITDRVVARIRDILGP